MHFLFSNSEVASVIQSVRLSVNMSVCLSVCSSNLSSVCLSVSLSLRFLSTFLSFENELVIRNYCYFSLKFNENSERLYYLKVGRINQETRTRMKVFSEQKKPTCDCFRPNQMS